jgi:hypothetical protein
MITRSRIKGPSVLITSVMSTVLLLATAATPQVYSPLPIQQLPQAGPYQVPSGSTAASPGDNTGAIGRGYIVLKVNDAYQIWTLNPTTGTYTAGTLQPDTSTVLWPPANGGDYFIPAGAGHVVYDPYGPNCGNPGGRWIYIEQGLMHNPDGTKQAGFYLGVSQSDSPDPSGLARTVGTCRARIFIGLCRRHGMLRRLSADWIQHKLDHRDRRPILLPRFIQCRCSLPQAGGRMPRRFVTMDLLRLLSNQSQCGLSSRNIFQ